MRSLIVSVISIISVGILTAGCQHQPENRHGDPIAHTGAFVSEHVRMKTPHYPSFEASEVHLTRIDPEIREGLTNAEAIHFGGFIEDRLQAEVRRYEAAGLSVDEAFAQAEITVRNRTYQANLLEVFKQQ